jgi:tetratricopeptide (TPR) repeat protein
MQNGVLQHDEKNLSFLAQSWVGAKEYDKAVATYQQLAELVKDGNPNQQIAEIRLQQGKFQDVVKAASKAIEKGELKNPGNLYLALGMATFNLKQFDASLEAFTQAKDIDSSKRMATQWLKFVEREKRNAELLAQNS